MIYILTALTAEARPLTEALKLKKKQVHGRFRIYENPEEQIMLAVTGPGGISAAAVTGMLLGASSGYGTEKKGVRHDGDFLISFGCGACIAEGAEPAGGNHFVSVKEAQAGADEGNRTCAAEKSQQGKHLYIGNKLINLDSQRTFYPDLLIRSGLPEAEFVTGSRVLNRDGEQKENSFERLQGKVKGQEEFFTAAQSYHEAERFHGEKTNEAGTILYDMESAAVYEAGSFFLGPHQMSFLRVVTDEGNGETVTAADVENEVREALPDLLAYLSAVKDFMKPQKTDGLAGTHEMTGFEEQMNDGSSFREEDLAVGLCCSVTMRHQLHQLLVYCRAAKIPWRDKIRILYNEGRIPVVSREEGKKVLKLFENQCLRYERV